MQNVNKNASKKKKSHLVETFGACFPATDGGFEAIVLDLLSCLLLQLLSVIASGGSSCVEDQTDLLGFTTQRSKCHC